MTSKVSIISSAFVLLGRVRPINDLTDDDQTIAASNFYEALYPNVLTQHPWRFATRLRELNQLVAKPILKQWQFAYQLPAEYINLYRLHPNADFRIYEDKIFINLPEPLILEYISRVKESKFPHYFELLMIYTIAGNMAMMVTQQEALAALWNTKADQQLILSRTTDSQTQPSPVVDKNPIFRSHFGSRRSLAGHL